MPKNFPKLTHSRCANTATNNKYKEKYTRIIIVKELKNQRQRENLGSSQMKESTYDISIKTIEVRRQKIVIFKVVIENNSNIEFYTQ